MSSSDFFRNFQPLFESKDVDMEEKVTKAEEKRKADKEDAAVKALAKDKKASNVKETAGAFFRKYSDIIKEAEEDDADDKKDEDKDEDKDDKKKEWVPPWKKDGKKDDKSDDKK